MREARVATWLDGLGGDFRHGVRVLRRQPLPTALVVLTLSLGIGANAAIFSVFEAVLLRPLPFAEPDRLVLLTDGQRGERGMTSPTIPELLDVREASRTLDGVAFFDTRDFQIAGGEEPQRVLGARVDPSFLSMLGVRPERGRLFDQNDRALAGSPSDAAIVVLSNGLWRRNFGADPSVVGRTLDDQWREPRDRRRAAGHVLVSGTSAPRPSTSTSRIRRRRRTRRALESSPTCDASMRSRASHPATTVDTARAELGSIAGAMAAAHPDLYPTRGAGADSGFFMSATPLRESLTQNSRPIAADAARRGRPALAHRVREHRAVPVGAGHRARA